NSDGYVINGFVLKPKDYDPTKKYPAVLEIHGGPHTSFGHVFFHEMQVMASDGCFVMYCDPRGGTGRGRDFYEIGGKWGDIDYKDLMEFVDEVLKVYPAIDEKKLGVTGGSYGGFMTNWIIGNTDRFAAAVSQRSIAEWGHFNLVGDIPGTGMREIQSDIWDDFEKVYSQSPLKHVHKAKTPTMFIHSFEDYRCTQPEAEQMYRALLNNKVDTRICFFKGENHELSRSGKPKHRLRRLKEITQWLYKYIKA
ncbi:MAG: S9 family peptidase, partial [Clostridia bacterium]|nr:S9 family peptidase [Clostridia bacterium]